MKKIYYKIYCLFLYFFFIKKYIKFCYKNPFSDSYYLSDFYKYKIYNKSNWCKIWCNSDIEFFYKVNLHRKIGPALTRFDNESLWWYRYGKRHRVDGPAFIDHPLYPEYEWWFEGKEITEQKYWNR